MSKKHLRELFRDKRKSFSVKENLVASECAANHFLAQPLFQQSNSIALYLAHDGEMDCGFLIKAIFQSGKQCYLPVLSSTKEKTLQFAEYAPNDKLSPNQYGILEPQTAKIIPPEQLDVVIMPLVAFDRMGHRLGMGGGYYDKTFAFLREGKKKTPLLIGLAYSAQEIDVLPADEWDVPLYGILTEKGFFQY